MKPALHTFAYSDPVRPMIDPYECGWQDGGCFIFAVALCLWLAPDAEPACLYRASLKDEQTADHWVCHIDGFFLDSDGVYTEAGLLNQWNHHPCMKEAMMLEAPAYPPRVVSVLTDDRVSREIKALLEARFGHPKKDELLSVLGRGLEDFVPTQNRIA